MDVTLVTASAGDAERLAEISKRAFDTDVEVGGTGGGPPGYDAPAFYARVLRYVEAYLVREGEDVVGGVLVHVAGRHGVLERIFVDPDRMRRGIGSAALRLAEEACPGVSLWSLGTPEFNTRTKPFYEKAGYRQVGWDEADGQPRGRWYDKRVGEADPFHPVGSLRDGARDVLAEGVLREKGESRTVTSRRTGQSLSVAHATLEDPSGQVVLVLWGSQVDRVAVGDRVRVDGGYVAAYGGVLQLNVGYGRLIVRS
jgi:GNAT superfamily N-acetyltransferase